MNSEMLQLRGAINLLSNAKKKLIYKQVDTSDSIDTKAWYIIHNAEISLRIDLKILLGQNKEFSQVELLHWGKYE